VHGDLRDKDDQLLGVLISRQESVLVHGVRDANRQSDDEDDHEHDQADEQVASNLAPHADDGPDDHGHE